MSDTSSECEVKYTVKYYTFRASTKGHPSIHHPLIRRHYRLPSTSFGSLPPISSLDLAIPLLMVSPIFTSLLTGSLHFAWLDGWMDGCHSPPFRQIVINVNNPLAVEHMHPTLPVYSACASSHRSHKALTWAGSLSSPARTSD